MNIEQKSNILVPEEIKEGVTRLRKVFNSFQDGEKTYISMLPAIFYLLSLNEDGNVCAAELADFSAGMMYLADHITGRIHILLEESEKLVSFLEEQTKGDQS